MCLQYGRRGRGDRNTRNPAGATPTPSFAVVPSVRPARRPLRYRKATWWQSTSDAATQTMVAAPPVQKTARGLTMLVLDEPLPKVEQCSVAAHTPIVRNPGDPLP